MNDDLWQNPANAPATVLGRLKPVTTSTMTGGKGPTYALTPLIIAETESHDRLMKRERDLQELLPTPGQGSAVAVFRAVGTMAHDHHTEILT